MLTMQVAGVPLLLANGRALRTGTRRALALAVLLGLEGAMARDRLLDLLWPGAERAAARRNLRRELFRLREVGWAIADHGQDGVAPPAATLLWPDVAGTAPQWLHGLEDLGGDELDEWLQMQRARLQRDWIDALENAAAGREHADDPAGALRLWTALLREEIAGPDHAPARRAAIRLHQQLGQHAEALALSRAAGPRDERIRKALTSTPATGLRSTPAPEEVVSRARGAGAATSSLPSRMPFIGRAAALASIGDALAAQRLVFIDGAAGVGKTRLALEAAAPLGGTLHVRCRPEDAADAFGSALRLLAMLRDAAPAADAGLPPWVRRELATLVPEWGPVASDPTRSAPEQTLVRMKRAFEVAWRTLARDNFAAVVLDDWQWADESSLALWTVDAAPDADWPVARLVIHRTGELPEAALERRRALIDRGEAVAVHVDELGVDAVLALVRTLSGSAAGERFAARLHRATGGNPMFLQETLRHLLETRLIEVDAHGRWHTPFDAMTADYAELAVPPSVRETVLARARALGPDVRRVLEAACLAGDALTPRLLAPAAALDELATAAAMDHALAAGLLTADRPAGTRGVETPATYRFAHDLLVQSLAESLPPARRQVLHARLAAQLVAEAGPPGRIARHFTLAGDRAQAGVWEQRAGDAAAARGARRDALRHYERALEGTDDPQRRTDLQLARLAELRALNDMPALAAVTDAALGDAARAGRTRTLDVLIARAVDRSHGGRAAEALAELDAIAGDAALSPAQRLELQVERSRALNTLGRHDESYENLRALLQSLEPSALADRLRVVALLGNACFNSGRFDEARAATVDMLALCRQLGDDYRAVDALTRLASSAREHGRADEAERLSQEAREAARRAGHVHGHRAALYNLVTLLADQGRVDEAEGLIDEAEALTPFWAEQLLRHLFVEARAYLYYLRGDAPGLRTALANAVASARVLNHPYALLGALRLACDLYLSIDATDTAATLLAEAEALLATIDKAAGRRYEIAGRRLRILWLQGDAAAARALVAKLMPDYAAMRAEDRGALLAGALRLATHDHDAATFAALHVQADTIGDLSLEMRTQLAIALLDAAASGLGDIAQARARVTQLLADPHLPRLEARHLERALRAR